MPRFFDARGVTGAPSALAVLALALAAAVAAVLTRTRTLALAGTPVRPTAGPLSDFAACLSGFNIPVVLPTDAGYAAASASLGAKSPRHPIAVAYPPTPRSIADTITCALRANLPMTVRNGGHSFQGDSVRSDHLVVDVSKTCDGTTPDTTPSVDRSQTPPTLTITAGCLHADVLYALHRNNVTDHFAMTGGMPLVGYIGWAMGGGFGNTTPAAGLGCDHIINWRIVLFNGTSIDVNAETHVGLFKSLCGGGGTDLGGVVTHATIRMTPHDDVYTRIILSYPQHALPDVLNRLQTLVGGPRRGSMVPLGGHGPTIRPNRPPGTLHHVCLLYLGSIPRALDLLEEFDLLSPDLFGDVDVDVDVDIDVNVGKRIDPIGQPWHRRLASYLPRLPRLAPAAFPGTPPQLALVNHAPALRPTLSLVATRPYANIILAQTETYPEAMAPMILVDSLAMDQRGMCRALAEMGGSCSSANLPHFGSKVTTDIILNQLIADRGSVLFDVGSSTTLGHQRNEYRRKYAPGIVIDDVLDVKTWKSVFNVMESRRCSFMIPHVLGGRVGSGERVDGKPARAFTWNNGTLVLGVVSNLDDDTDAGVDMDDVGDDVDKDREHQWTCLRALASSMAGGRGASSGSAPPVIQAYYGYLGEPGGYPGEGGPVVLYATRDQPRLRA